MTEATVPGTGRQPLSGVRVVEVGVWHAGPGASAILADMGADVVKVETLDGDPERVHGNIGPMEKVPSGIPNWTPLFEFSNRSKRGISLDITSSGGREALEKLVAEADVFVTNLRTSTKPKLGLDYPTLAAINPHLVYLSVTGFGAEGPRADVGGFDPMGQAISGMLFLAGLDTPTLLQSIILDQLTAITASHAVLTALYNREADPQRRGQEVSTSLYGSAVWLMEMNMMLVSILGEEVDVSWDRAKNPPLRTTYRCGDGGWLIGTMHPQEKYWGGFCAAIGRPDLEHDPRYATRAARMLLNEELIAIIDEIMLTRTRDEWVEVFNAHGVLFAPVNRISDVLSDEQARANGYVADMVHRQLGALRVPGFPIRYGNFPTPTVRREAPGLGEHTDEILAEVGYTADRISELRADRSAG
jgi:crotonobetainyl-CoA:carnitine CoA-transferase CaiB-like acyl-CoA transferase